MIGYVTIGTDDLDRARAYYDALFESIGARRLLQLEDQRGFTMYGVAMNRPSVVVTRPYNGEPMSAGNGNMVALAMDSMEKVDAFHARALALGAADEGAPGFRGTRNSAIISAISATSTAISWLCSTSLRKRLEQAKALAPAGPMVAASEPGDELILARRRARRRRTLAHPGDPATTSDGAARD